MPETCSPLVQLFIQNFSVSLQIDPISCSHVFHDQIIFVINNPIPYLIQWIFGINRIHPELPLPGGKSLPLGSYSKNPIAHVLPRFLQQAPDFHHTR